MSATKWEQSSVENKLFMIIITNSYFGWLIQLVSKPENNKKSLLSSFYPQLTLLLVVSVADITFRVSIANFLGYITTSNVNFCLMCKVYGYKSKENII